MQKFIIIPSGNVAVFTTMKITARNRNWFHQENNRLNVGNSCCHSLCI